MQERQKSMAEVLKENEDLKKAANKHDDELAEISNKCDESKASVQCIVHIAQCTVHCRISIKSTNLSFLYCHIFQNDCKEAFPSKINKKKKMC